MMHRLCSSRPSLPSPSLWLPLPQDLCMSPWKIREGRRISPTVSLLRGSFASLSEDQVKNLMGKSRDEAEAAAKIMEICTAVADGSSTNVTPERPPWILRSRRSRSHSSGAPSSWPQAGAGRGSEDAAELPYAALHQGGGSKTVESTPLIIQTTLAKKA